MQFTTTPTLKSRKPSDLLILPFGLIKGKVKPLADIDTSLVDFETPIAMKDFKGKEGEFLLLYSSNKQEKRILLLGLGEVAALTLENLRCVYAVAVKVSHAKKAENISLALPNQLSFAPEELTRGIVEGLLLANYSFTKLKHATNKDNPSVLIKQINLIGGNKAGLAIAKKCLLLCQAVYAARDLVNGNADDITPHYLGVYAKELAVKYPSLKTKVLGPKAIEKEKMGLLLAVSRGSFVEPTLITLEYRGDPNSKEVTALVGKGVTYDTGGLNLKPTGSMETMRCDMGGAAAVLGAMQAVAALGLKMNVVGVIPSTENSISSNSFKPGDVYLSHAGKSVEITNTDAEGRLILADAISYAIKHFSPTKLIDLATLTGAIGIALGPEATGLMSNDGALTEAFVQAGEDTFERVWQLPLLREYRDALKSDVADIKNWGGRYAGAIVAAIFIQEFVGKLPWVHLDIASTAYYDEPRRYHPKLGTGIGVRLLVSYLMQNKKAK